MTARLLDGKATAAAIRQEIAEQVTQWCQFGGPIPRLVAILVGDDPASQVYVRNKEKACQSVGMQSQVIRLASETSDNVLTDLLEQLNNDSATNGILVQLPLPKHLDTQRILDLINPIKDVDAFSPENVGLLAQGRPRYLPCTPHGVLQILARHDCKVMGKHVVIIGRSDIVGKPLALMLVQKEIGFGAELANATVTICHSKSRDLPSLTRTADFLVAAVGQAHLVTADMVKPGAVVIDVGINRQGNSLVGDVDFSGVSQVAGAITPVPGGIGPLTIAMLLRNTLTACQLQNPTVRRVVS